MTHFLNYTCPEFAEEVIDVFTRYTVGDPALIQESAALRDAAHQAQLKSLQDDIEAQASCISQYKVELADRANALNQATRATEALRSDTDQVLQARELEINILRADSAKYAEHVQKLQEKKAKLEAEVKEAQDSAEEVAGERDHLQEAMDGDSTRPCNVFKEMDEAKIPNSTRHQESRLWYAARNITINTCIYQSHENYRAFMHAIVDHECASKVLNDPVKRDFARKLASPHAKIRNWAKRHIYTLFKGLKQSAQDAIASKIATMTGNMFKEVFALNLFDSVFSLKICLNNVAMYQLLCKHLCNVYNVKYSTEIETKYLAKMALNMTDFTDGKFKVALGNDYSEFCMYDDVELHEFDDE
jgi:hypothetical protein